VEKIVSTLDTVARPLLQGDSKYKDPRALQNIRHAVVVPGILYGYDYLVSCHIERK